MGRALKSLRVLVVYKKTTYQHLQRDQHNRAFSELLARNEQVVRRLVDAHREHIRTLGEIRRIFGVHGVSAVFRHHCSNVAAQDYDLVVTVGGDGTLLWASHFVGETPPMLAVNSAPEASVGHFCRSVRETFEADLQQFANGTLSFQRLLRMQVHIGDALITSRVLNDVLYCHECAAATARYEIALDSHSEEHRSSGIWLGPPAGSTAAMLAAGGSKLSLDATCLQYVVREPYEPPGLTYRLRQGLTKKGQVLRLRNLMDAGRIYIDGSHRSHKVEFGECLYFSQSNEYLTLLG